MTGLERRYRSVLRLLPASYRNVWEEDMVAAFLDSMKTGDPDTDEYLADHARPSWSEMSSITALAIRLRLGGGPEAQPRQVAWGEAARLAVLVAMLIHAVWAAAGTALTLWRTGNVTWLPAVPAEWAAEGPPGIWYTAWDLIGNAWLLAYIALVLGHRRPAQAVALLALGPAVAFTATTAPPSLSAWAPRLLDVLVILAMSVFHREAPPVPPRPWLLALPVGVLVVPAPLFAVQATVEAAWVLDRSGLACTVLAVVIIGYLASAAVGSLRHPPSWSLALALLAVTTLAYRLATLPDYIQSAPTAERATVLTLGLAQAVALTAAGAPLAVFAARTLRRLPAVAVSSTHP